MRQRNFPSCDYGPFQLRRLLRTRLLPGERIVGWAPALVNPPVWLLVAAAGLVMIPGAGHLMLALILAGHRRVVILTDSRMLILSRMAIARDPEGRGVRLDLPLHSVSIQRTRSTHRFKVTPRGRPRGEVLSFETRTAPSQRLVEGMELLTNPEI